MLANLYTDDLCIITSYWQVDGISSLAASAIVAAFAAFIHEWIKYIRRRFLRRTSLLRASLLSADDTSEHTEFTAKKLSSQSSQRIALSLLFGLQLLIAYFIMLLIMTYNIYLIASVLAGAIFGFYVFNSCSTITLSIEDIDFCH